MHSLEIRICQASTCLVWVTVILGYVDGIEGYFNNCGWGEFGVTHGAIAGELAALIVLQQKTSIDIAPFLFDRFSSSN